MDWLDLLAVQGTLKSLLQTTVQNHQFFCTQLSSQSNSHPYTTTGKTIALTRRTFVGKVMSLLFNMLSRLVITFLPRSKRLLISWLQSPSAVILEPKKTASKKKHRLRKIFFTVLKKYKQISKNRNCTGRKLYPGGSVVKNSPTQETHVRFPDGKDPLEKELATHPSLPEKSHDQRSLAGYSP